MTERIRSLLEAALADTHPRTADPLPEVLRRGRASRLRHRAVVGVSGAAAVALMATGSLAVLNERPAETPAASSAASGDSGQISPPLPSELSKEAVGRQKLTTTVTDSEVQVYGLTLSAADGWEIADDTGDSPVTRCDFTSRSIVVDSRVGPSGKCKLRRQIWVNSWQPMTYMYDLSPTAFNEGVSEVVLPGGQPVWLSDHDVNNFTLFKRGGWAGFNATVPWAGATLSADTPTEELDDVLSMVRGAEVQPRPLILPDSAGSAHLAGTGKARIDATDADVVGEVIKRLAELDQVVEEGELPCEPAEQLSGVWQLAGKDMAKLTLTYPSGMPQAVIAISSTDECAFATSSMGGRVWLPDGFLADIQALLSTGTEG